MCLICTQNIVFPITTACIRDLTIRGSIRYTTGVYPAAIDLVARGKVHPQKLVSHRFPFEQAEEAFETVRQGGDGVLKVLIQGVEDWPRSVGKGTSLGSCDLRLQSH